MVLKIEEKIKPLLVKHKTDIYVTLLIVLVSITSFGLGRLSAILPKKTPVTITENAELKIPNAEKKRADNQTANSAFSIQNSALGKYVASKNGKSYHFPWCAGAKFIKEENKIWFASKEEAVKVGYTPAGNCPGL